MIRHRWMYRGYSGSHIRPWRKKTTWGFGSYRACGGRYVSLKTYNIDLLCRIDGRINQTKSRGKEGARCYQQTTPGADTSSVWLANIGVELAPKLAPATSTRLLWMIHSLNSQLLTQQVSGLRDWYFLIDLQTFKKASTLRLLTSLVR